VTLLDDISREAEGLAIWATHGVLDGITTAAAAISTPTAAEANPLMRALLRAGVGWAVGTMLLVVGLISVAWPRLARWADLPRWFAPTLAAVGLLVALLNVLVVVGGVA
jgi:hypothetical protein